MSLSIQSLKGFTTKFKYLLRRKAHAIEVRMKRDLKSVSIHRGSYDKLPRNKNLYSTRLQQSTPGVDIEGVHMLGTTLLSNTVPVPGTLTSYKLVRGSGNNQKLQVAAPM